MSFKSISCDSIGEKSECSSFGCIKNLPKCSNHPEEFDYSGDLVGVSTRLDLQNISSPSGRWGSFPSLPEPLRGIFCSSLIFNRKACCNCQASRMHRWNIRVHFVIFELKSLDVLQDKMVTNVHFPSWTDLEALWELELPPQTRCSLCPSCFLL